MSVKVLIIQRRMTEYRAPLFEMLRQRLAEHSVELQVIYGTSTAEEAMRGDTAELTWGIQAPCSYFSVGNSRFVWQHISRSSITGQDLIIIPHENMLLENYLLLFLHRWPVKTKLAFWGHGANFQSPTRGGARQLLKEWTARQVDWWFAYTSLSAERIAAYGFPRERVTILNNAIDTAAIRTWREEMTDGESVKLLRELGLEGTNLAVFIGGLYREKRLDFLLSAADELKRLLPTFELLIIGDGPDRDPVRNFAASRPWCRWVGTKYGRDKVAHLSLAKIILNPGLVGLNILDSFTLGIPLLTTDCGIHSPEIAYLQTSRNGVMTPDDPGQFVAAAKRLLTDHDYRREMARNCLESAQDYSLEKMVTNFRDGILKALAPAVPAIRHVAIIWQRFLPYHSARIRCLQKRLAAVGCRLTAIEVASRDDAYALAEVSASGEFEQRCCFPGDSYHRHTVGEIHARVLQLLTDLRPDAVFAPATAFPEGMAADVYRMKHGGIRIMMDDAWEHTDRRGWLTRQMKRFIHRNIDGVFIPAPSHRQYYAGLGFPAARVVYGVDVVDNDYFAFRADRARSDSASERARRGMPDNFFLFTGRFLPRKGLETLLAAFRRYRSLAGTDGWDLVLVGDGPQQAAIREAGADIRGLHFAGMVAGDDLAVYYGLARALVVPSIIDQWGLVVNEGLAAGLPVLVSRGCGAARTLVQEEVNGWTFPSGESDSLADLMVRMSSLPEDALAAMGAASRSIVADWSLDRFADGVIEAMALPRREPAGLISNLATRLWKGRVSVN